MKVEIKPEYDAFKTEHPLPYCGVIRYDPGDATQGIDNMNVTVSSGGNTVRARYDISPSFGNSMFRLPDIDAIGPVTVNFKFNAGKLFHQAAKSKTVIMDGGHLNLEHCDIEESMYVRTLPDSRELTINDIREEEGLEEIEAWSLTAVPDIPDVYGSILPLLEYLSSFEILGHEKGSLHIKVDSITEAMENRRGNVYTLSLLAFAILDRLGFSSIAVFDEETSLVGVKVSNLCHGQYEDMVCSTPLQVSYDMTRGLDNCVLFDITKGSFDESIEAGFRHFNEYSGKNRVICDKEFEEMLMNRFSNSCVKRCEE